MRDYNNRGGDRGGRRFGGGNRGGDRPMFQAVCGNCGKDCEVPFRPTGERPVLCSECFGEQRSSEGPRRFDNGRPGFNSRPQQRNSGPDMQRQFDELNSKLETIIDILHTMNKPAGKKAKKVSEPVVENVPASEEMPAEPSMPDFLPEEA